jgi:hypothetical protein
VIHRSYPREEAVGANRYVERQQKAGNVVLRVSGYEKAHVDVTIAPPPALVLVGSGRKGFRVILKE